MHPLLTDLNARQRQRDMMAEADRHHLTRQLRDQAALASSLVSIPGTRGGLIHAPVG
jgi:hypothetical protein